VQDA